MAIILIILKFVKFYEETSQPVFGKNMIFSANTLKVNFRVSNWPFQSTSNLLNVVMENSVKNFDSDLGNSCETFSNSNENFGGYLQWLQITLSGVSMYPKIFYILICNFKVLFNSFF